jgi:propanediol dehydratase small subunit
MTADLATALLNRATNGNELLQILDTLTSEIEQENIADFLEHAATLQEVQF